MVSSAPRVSPGLGGPAGPYHISCLVGPKLKSSMVFSRLAKRASDTATASLTSPSACLVFSGVTRLSVPRSSSRPQRPQLESDSSIATTCSKVMRCGGCCSLLLARRNTDRACEQRQSGKRSGAGGQYRHPRQLRFHVSSGNTGSFSRLSGVARGAYRAGLRPAQWQAEARPRVARPNPVRFGLRRLRGLLAVDLQPGVDQRDAGVDDRTMQALLRSDKLDELVGALDIRRTILERA